MKKEDEARRERLLYVLKEKGVKSASDIVDTGHPEYFNIYKQLFSDGVKTLSLNVISTVLEKFPDVSSDYIMLGWGSWERKTHIVTTHKQDIHVEGGQAAISQSGEAKIEAIESGEDSKELFTNADIAKWVSEGNVGALVGVILNQKDEIIRLKEQRIRDLEHSVLLADANLFPPVK